MVHLLPLQRLFRSSRVYGCGEMVMLLMISNSERVENFGDIGARR